MCEYYDCVNVGGIRSAVTMYYLLPPKDTHQHRMSIEIKPIPAFYCCYLLRSTLRNTAFYVGSTPDPLRRLSQHNGLHSGGAVRTARNHLQPWDMLCLVSGFPSNIAALQFEWAWQNTHLTTRISEEERLTIKRVKPHLSSNTNSTQGRAARGGVPRSSNKISCLHLLLRAKSFTSWPLQVRFFCRDAYELWLRWSERVHGEIPAGIRVSLDLPYAMEATNQHDELQNVQKKLTLKPQAVSRGGIDGIVVGYSTLKDHAEKSLLILAEGQVNRCRICARDVDTEVTTVLVCPQRNCQAIFHMTCLATRFLEAENGEMSVIPRAGTCPHCRSELQWIDMVKEMSLRVRGKSELARLTKKRKMPETRAQKEDIPFSEGLNQDACESSMHYDAFDSPSDYEDPLPLNWDYQDLDEDGESSFDNFVSDDSMPNRISKIGEGTSPISRSKIEIQDSELDDTEILDLTNGDFSNPLERR